MASCSGGLGIKLYRSVAYFVLLCWLAGWQVFGKRQGDSPHSPAAARDKRAGRFLRTDKDIRRTLCRCSGEQAGRFLVKDKGIRHPLPPLPEINGPADFANRQEVN